MTEKEILVLLQQAPRLLRLSLAGRCLQSEAPPTPDLLELEGLEIRVKDRILPLFYIKAPRLRRLDFRFQPFEDRSMSSWGTEEAWLAASSGWFPELRHLETLGVAHSSGVGRKYDSFAAAFIRAHPQLEIVKITAITGGSQNPAVLRSVLQKAYGIRGGEAQLDDHGRLRAPGELRELLGRGEAGRCVAESFASSGHSRNCPLNVLCRPSGELCDPQDYPVPY